MMSRKVIPILIVCAWLSRSALAQEGSRYPTSLLTSSAVQKRDFRMTVFPITELKYVGLGIEAKIGTGFCLDPKCRFIGTNYHVAAVAHPRKIGGQRVIGRYLATGPQDEGATVNDVFGGSTKFTLSRDLAIFELRHSLPKHQGIPFSLNDLYIGQDVDIYGYPKEGMNPFRSFLQFHGKFKGETLTGLLAFDYSLSAGKAIRPGASGGIIVDSKTQQIVGILNSIANNGELVAIAVPVQSLVDFVSNVQPGLAQNLFPSAKGIFPPGDMYPKFAPPPALDVLRHRPEEPAEVKVLRSKAQPLADSMRNFVAVQTFAWGSGNNDPAAISAYEVQILDGYQRFREYPDGKKELQEIPLPTVNNSITPGDEWSRLPAMVGTDLGLKIQQAATTVINGQRVKVFLYQADPEDELCRVKSHLNLGFFAVSKLAAVGCYGEVWTDEDTNILRISENFERCGGWKDCRAVVTYGWLRRPGETPRLIPLAILTQAELKKKVYWCRGQFTGYQEFSSKFKILSGKVTP
jgi:hypothetical protein